MNIEKIIRRLIPFICLGVVGNLAFSYFTTDKGSFSGWGAIRYGWLFVAAVLALLPWAWHCVRLRIWTKYFGVKISWKNLLSVVVSTDVGGAVTPTAVGGAPLKLAMLHRHGMRAGQAAMLTFLNNIEDIIFYLLVIPFSLWLTDGWSNPLLDEVFRFLEGNWEKGMAILVSLALLFFVLKKWLGRKKSGKPASTWRSKLRHWSKDFGEAWQLVRTTGWKPFLLSMMALICQWATKFSILIAVLLALNVEADFAQILLLQWMVYVAILFVPTPGATGGAEAAFLFVFGGIIPSGMAAIVMAFWRLMSYYFMLTFGAFLFYFLEKDVPKMDGLGPLISAAEKKA